MNIHVLKREIWLPKRIEEVFAFFADAPNLEVLTPSWLSFKVVTPGVITMAPGVVIDYRLRLHGLPIRWQSEITDWEPPYRFVDVQRRGPYRLWIHEHRFDERDGGTLARDRVEYSVLGGRLVNRFFVVKDLNRIFDYRAERLKERFTHDF